MSDYAIRLLTPDDLEDALRLSSTAGWNQRADDWRMLVGLAPAASFVACSGARVVGTAIGIDYGRFSWIAMMLVDPAWRGRGVGRRLLEAAMDAVPADRPIRLDATPLGRPLYQSCGFEDEAMLTRYVSEPAGRTISPPPRGRFDAVQPLTAADLQAVGEADLRVFGGNRRAVLEWALATAAEYCQIAATGASLPQYCLGRRGRLFDQIGPVVAADAETAYALVRAALASAADRALVVDGYDGHVRFATWLRDYGFRAQRPLFRMQRAPQDRTVSNSSPPPPPLTELAIFGPEFA